MNSSDICHQVPDCPGLFVDAFRGHFLREHTKNPDATFILSHYHGDHYQQLPRDGKYRGPSKIHCTPITARLLIKVHNVPANLVVEHEYEATFRHPIFLGEQTKDPMSKDEPNGYANITFYDANHCPGACIILIELPDGKTTHLHTGDMRYHPRFQSYPLLAKSVKDRNLDLVYLDTTYCHPKHNFLTQNEAIESIASQTEELLSVASEQETSEKTLVLLSCYSIGKEKVLYEASKRSSQPIYVSDKKWKMLQCIQQHKSDTQTDVCNKDDSSSSLTSNAEHINILQRCTRDASHSDLHVIPMGLAGEMWPYFQPNFQKLAKYVEDLSSMELKKEEDVDNESATGNKPLQKEYTKVVAFIPTGWASASNWNKKNAISTKVVELSPSRSLHVEVRLISYSEHSTFPELVSFIQYLKPRKVIPTVYSDQNHKRQIENRFRNMLDSSKAKQAFFRTMTTKKNTTNSPTARVYSEAKCPSSIVPCSELGKGPVDIVKRQSTAEEGKALSGNPQSFRHEISFQGKDKNTLMDKDDDDEIEVVGVVSPSSSNLSGPSGIKNDGLAEKINLIVSMGYDRHRAKLFLEKRNGNIEHAMNDILSEPEKKVNVNYLSETSKESIELPFHLQQESIGKKRKISDFFAQKK